MSKQLVSIIIPAYNREKQVKDAIVSVLNQEHREIEIILVDDGSNDNTLKVMEQYTYNCSNVNIISQKNQGALKARLAGLNVAQGDFIVFLDSDDTINSRFISGLLEAQAKNDADIAVARIHQHFKIGPFKTMLIYRKYPKHFDMHDRKDVLPFMWVGNCAKLFKRDAVNMVDYGFVANEDLAINYFNYVKYHNIAASNHSIYHIRPSSNSLAQNYIRQNLSYIQNTILPLENELKLFKENGYYKIFYDEIEAIFIHNILERIDNIKTNNTVNHVQKKDLITLLIEYLNFHFPNWLNNKYYKSNFINGSISEIYFALSTKKQVKEYYSILRNDAEETIKAFNRVLQKENKG